MTRHQFKGIIESIIDETHTAILATVDSQGAPHIRWMTPGCIEDRPEAFFMITTSRMSKVDHIQSNSQAELMFQSRSLDKIVNISGSATVLDNPSLRSEVLECVGKHLHSFWKINTSESELVVIEFLFNSATQYNPKNGTKITISFAGE